ncbi:DUF559 domain-containing protein [Aestuariimicrobium sp. T2.26MG-19.2B]|uniref:DUF559 domain-containing protein n=1 Tax=Aestuariimicrobium sp. T2.26MG-19.2B TaxID=3040679 RepID=UPI002477ACEB|nr:DUF559 domain-containing protein [Aestuariimicrobium sp. T2.26MG-19.2B]CAI9401222.1 hypothetical protein AESSP_00549 [Aestuariimicrobium sp. T2.26MG-19.2B]
MDHSVIIRRQLPSDQRSRLDQKVRHGNLARILPGAYTADESGSWIHRVLAVQGLRPSAVLSRTTAARLDFWPDLPSDDVHVDGARFRGAPEWLHPTARAIPGGLVMRRGELRLTATPLTVLDLVDDVGGRAIDEGLRRRVVTLPLLHQTMDEFNWRRGNTLRRRLLHESRDQPWSELERDGHNLMRRHRIKGWHANHRVRIKGHVFYIDMAIPALGLAIELDGWSFHRTREDLERDAARHNWLQYAGWTVLRFTSTTLEEIPTWVHRFRTLRARVTQQVA